MPLPEDLTDHIATLIGLYILDANHQPVEVDLETWAEWYEDFEKNRRIGHLETPRFDISTVFLANGRHGLLFETMLDDKRATGNRLTFWRYATWDEAVAGHAAVVERCREIEEGEA